MTAAATISFLRGVTCSQRDGLCHIIRSVALAVDAVGADDDGAVTTPHPVFATPRIDARLLRHAPVDPAYEIALLRYALTFGEVVGKDAEVELEVVARTYLTERVGNRLADRTDAVQQRHGRSADPVADPRYRPDDREQQHNGDDFLHDLSGSKGSMPCITLSGSLLFLHLRGPAQIARKFLAARLALVTEGGVQTPRDVVPWRQRQKRRSTIPAARPEPPRGREKQRQPPRIAHDECGQLSEKTSV